MLNMNIKGILLGSRARMDLLALERERKVVFLPIQPWQFISGHFGEGVVVQMHVFGIMFISEVSIFQSSLTWQFSQQLKAQ